MEDNEPRSPSLYFDPDKHPENTLKMFNEFCEMFVLRYNALYPDPPKVSMDAALSRWKILNATTEEPEPKPTVDQYDTVRNDWRSKDKVTKFLGLFSSKRFKTDWTAAQPDETLRDNATWVLFLQYMREYYKPTENSTLKNFHFRDLHQGPQETFTAFCSRVALDAGHCSFKCASPDCTAEATAARDQIVIGTRHQNICEEALLKSWDLATLRTEGMRIESATKGGVEISGEDVNRLGKYSFKNTKQRQPLTKQKTRNIACYRCGEKFTSLEHHQTVCKGINNKCSHCSKMEHLPTVCRSKASGVKKVETDSHPSDIDTTAEAEDCTTYNVNLFVINSS